MLEYFSRWLRRYQGVEANPLYRLAAEVATGRTSMERALEAAQTFNVIGRLADGDLLELDQQVEFEARTNVEFALILGRLNAAAARAKGFERVLVDLYLRVADLLLRDDQEPEREYYLRESLLVAQRISYVNGQRRALNRLARIAFERGETEMARDLLLQQLDAGREESDTREEIETAILLADISLADGDVANAHDLYHRAARSARRIGYYTGTVDALLRQVGIVRERGDLHGCLMLLRQAGEAAERTIDTSLQAEVAFRTGALMRELSMAEEAIERLDVALRHARALGDLSMESRALGMLSELEERLGRVDDAERHYRDVVTLESRLGNRTDVARAQLALGRLAMAQERPADAVQPLQEARELARLMDDDEFTVESNGLLGQALVSLGRESEALSALEYAVQGSRRLRDLPGEIRWLIAAGEAMLRTGETANATALAERAEELARMTADNTLRVDAYALIGQVALVDRRLQDAEDAFMSAAAASRAAGRPSQALHYLPLLARLAAEMGSQEDALRYIDQAVEEAERADDPQRVATFHGQAARMFVSAGKTTEGEQRFTLALRAAEKAGDDRLRARALQGIAAIYDTSGDLDIALDHYQQALQAALASDDTRTIATANYNIGAILVDEERDEEARDYLIEARDTAEMLRDVALAEKARILLRLLAPPPVSYGMSSYDDESNDFTINEEPIRPRNYDSLY